MSGNSVQRPSWMTGIVCCACSVVLSGCQAIERSLSNDELIAGRDAYLNQYHEDLADSASRSGLRIQTEYMRSADSQRYDVLILSGGGALGAFGAGFLDGWASVSEVEFQRPQFDVVSGISTGALIAPFAFIGTTESYRTIIDLYRNPGADWAKTRSIFSMLPRNSAFLDISGLEAKIRTTINSDIARALSLGASENRQLLIGATNMDYGLLRVWDVARLARSLEPAQAAEDIASILLASSAIPSAFPPVLIDDLLYVDGGAAMQLVGGIDERGWAYVPDNEFLNFVDEDRPIEVRVWIIVNQKLLPDSSVTPIRWPAVAARSVDTLLRTSTLQSIQDAATYVELVDQHPQFNARLFYVAIPQDYTVGESEAIFDAEVMRDIVDLGRRMGADPDSWRTEVLRPGAPFQIE